MCKADVIDCVHPKCWLNYVTNDYAPAANAVIMTANDLQPYELYLSL